jgi:hypothetical protein
MCSPKLPGDCLEQKVPFQPSSHLEEPIKSAKEVPPLEHLLHSEETGHSSRAPEEFQRLRAERALQTHHVQPPSATNGKTKPREGKTHI